MASSATVPATKSHRDNLINNDSNSVEVSESKQVESNAQVRSSIEETSEVSNNLNESAKNLQSLHFDNLLGMLREVANRNSIRKT